MGDQLEHFIKDSRDHFDDEHSSEHLWRRIEYDLNKPSSSGWTWVWKVAAFFLLATTLYLSYDRWTVIVRLPSQ